MRTMSTSYTYILEIFALTTVVVAPRSCAVAERFSSSPTEQTFFFPFRQCRFLSRTPRLPYLHPISTFNFFPSLYMQNAIHGDWGLL